MKIIEQTFCIVEDDYNLDEVYNKFNELTGLDLEFEIKQDYGTSCYDISRFSEKTYSTLEKLENLIQKTKNNTLDKYEYITEDDVINYLRRKGILPEKDLLFAVDY